MPDFDPASFRDPEGRVFHSGGRVFRALSEAALVRMRRLESAVQLDTSFTN